MHSGGLQRYWDENACYERMREGGHIARRVTKRLVAAAARAMDAFVRADWRTVRETVQELRGQGEFLAGLLAEHQSLLRRQDTCGEHVATACITSPATYSAIPTRASLSRLGRRHNCFTTASA